MGRIAVDANEDVSAISLYHPRPVIMHGYVLPFIILYAIAIWTLFRIPEAGVVALAVVFCLQVLTCLFCRWFVSIRCLLTCSRMNSLYDATVVKVTPTPNNGCTDLVRLQRDSGSQFWFMFQKVKYVFDGDTGRFHAVKFPISEPLQFYNDWKGHQIDDEVSVAAATFGKNQMIIDTPKFCDLFIERATAPFFVFQVFCVALWCLDEYWYYSLFTLFMLVVFECTLVQQQMKNMNEIRAMGNKPHNVMVYRSKKWTQISSDELVVGDIVSLSRSKADNLIPCDMILLRGTCIVDESMLTGESVPVMKESIEEVADNDKIHLNVDGDSKLHILFGGTQIVQHTTASKASQRLKSPDNGCIAYVLRTGFNSAQGRLLKTILYSVKQVTANNLETFMFILFLLVFAVVAAAYVWIKGTQDPTRNRYKLFLECTLILTSVVPPELPIELSLAVNSSLLALTKLLVFCTEPFRIPFAGKIDICCFDKTGTLTKDEMIVDGIAGLGSSVDRTSSGSSLLSVLECPTKTVQVLASCHSLAQMDNELIGDPLEKAILESVRWTLSKADVVFPCPLFRTHPLKIYYRFHFSSCLQRMSVIAGHTKLGTSDIAYIAAVKGAPEVMRDMFIDPPRDYDQLYLDLSRRGSRVLALGYKDLGVLSHQSVRDLRRDDIECGLSFCGFVAISCPLKRDTRSVIKEILHASHHVTMITGDNPLTACHVAKELKLLRKERTTLILTRPNGFSNDWHWQSIDNTVVLPWKLNGLRDTVGHHDLCLTGDGIRFLESMDNDGRRLLKNILPVVRVYARVAPKQKEQVIVGLKAMGYVTLMCGDGTNDVGALKQAHIGVALLANAPESTSSLSLPDVNSVDDHHKKEDEQQPIGDGKVKKGSSNVSSRAQKLSTNRASNKQHQTVINNSSAINPHFKSANQKLNSIINELESEEKAQIVRLGDASIAAPFTAKMSSIRGVSHIIKQGRCTLVTTLQMFKILALNALILAYSQSVLYLDGVKFSDAQATIQALLLAGCFLFISRSKPLKELSRQRPLANIFNAYTLLTVMSQFAVHFYSLYTLSDSAHRYMGSRPNGTINSINNATGNVSMVNDIIGNETAGGNGTNTTINGLTDLEAEFQPNILNTVIYIISLAMQTTTFAVNYKGRPFMESLKDNRPLLVSLLVSVGGILLLSSGCIPETAEQFKIVPLPKDLQFVVQKVLLLDFFGSLFVDRTLGILFGRSHQKKILK